MFSCILFPIFLLGQSDDSLGETARRLRAERENRLRKEQIQKAPAPSAVDSTKPTSLGSSPTASSMVASTGIGALEYDEYAAAISKLLSSEEFAQLDQIADNARSSKSRFPGGAWKLYTFYKGLCGECQRATDVSVEGNIEHLKHWVAARPKSITARVALAQNYLEYAWLARGDGYADMVDQPAWKEFERRLQLVKTTLDQAETLKAKCPQWFLIKQRAARAQGLDIQEISAILEKGSSFEPLYYYLYQEQAYALEPRWYGEDGDSERYAAKVADQIGGKQGAFIYFRIATTLHCTGCSASELAFSHMSWPRIQEGYAALEEMYGTSKSELNEFAHLSIRAEDRAIASRLFLEIGDNWDRDAWRDKHYFESSRGWAFAPSPEQIALWRKASANAIEPGGAPYLDQVGKELEAKNAAVVKGCTDQSKGKDYAFNIMLKMDKDGNGEKLPAYPASPFSDCVVAKIITRAAEPPPHPDFLISLSFGTKSMTIHSQGATLPESGR